MEIASQLFDRLVKVTSVDFDATQAIGRRYRRQDEIGTPYCITSN
jgi:glycyl-tRNA synthetase